MSRRTPLRVFVFDSPRCCSQVFNKLWLAHPTIENIFHPLMGCSVYGPERLFTTLQHNDGAEKAYEGLAQAAGLNEETYQVAVNRLEKSVEHIEAKGKIPWIKDHALSDVNRDAIQATLHNPSSSWPVDRNPTVFSDEFLQSLTPVFLIRHPALMIPSFYRVQKAFFCEEAQDEDFKMLTSLRWARLCFDYYRSTPERRQVAGCDGVEKSTLTSPPIVVDAKDFVYNTKSTINALCQLLGIDSAGVQYEWEALSRDKWPADPIMQNFFKDMLESSGLRRVGAAAEEALNIDQEQAKWVREFGERDATTLRELVDDAVRDFEYLCQFKSCA